MNQYLAITHSLVTQIKFFVVPVNFANLAFSALYPCHVELNVIIHPFISDEAILITNTRINDSWMLEIANYLKNGILPKDNRAATKTKTRATKYALIYDILYR